MGNSREFASFPIEKEEEDDEADKPFGSHRHIPRLEDSLPSSAAKGEEHRQSTSKRDEQRKQFGVQDASLTIPLSDSTTTIRFSALSHHAWLFVVIVLRIFFFVILLAFSTASTSASEPIQVLPTLYLIVFLVLRDSLSWFRREVWVQMGGFSGGGGGLYDDAGWLLYSLFSGCSYPCSLARAAHVILSSGGLDFYGSPLSNDLRV
ncbi:hypothetical protein D9613_010734 [Agrocybe pediades]|uniref:Transmembrane protein n=1 Tax=Agrocybe pediades TaxID=84607 RepID=A0A8H4QLA8_9AGAR|nr:hypothetical protein D9613_010734 [Agrocybe pediades]